MSNRSAGLSFDEAFSQAQAEVPLEEEAPVTPSNVTPEPVEVSEEEQPAVKPGEEGGVFSSLKPEPSVEDPQGEDSHKVKVNGEIIEVTYQELVDGYSRHADYTRGKQELAEKEKEYDRAITLWKALESDYVNTVKALMSRANVQGQVAPPKSQDVDIESIVAQKLEEKLASDPRIQAFEHEQSLRQMNAIFAQVEKEFGLPPLSDEDKQLVLERADRDGNYDIRYIVWQMIQEKQRIEAERQNLALVSTVNGQRSGGPAEEVAPHVEYYSSPADAWKAAVAELGE